MEAYRRGLLLAALASGCLPSATGDPGLEEGELGVAAVVENGRARFALLLGGSPPPLSFGPETKLFIWPVTKEDFIREDGSVPTEADLAALSVRLDDQPARPDSCGRCLGRWNTSPQPVFAGDSCEPPSFARDRLITMASYEGGIAVDRGERIDSATRALAEAVRLRVRLEWPGPCACDEIELERRPDAVYSYQPLWSDSLDAWPFDRWALHPDGTLAGFNEQRIAVIDPAGRRRMAEVPAALREGHVVSAAAITYGGKPAFVFVAPSLDLVIEEDRYFLVETEPEIRVTSLPSLTDATFRPQRFESVDTSTFLILGGDEDGTFRAQLPNFYRCHVDEPTVRCERASTLASNDCISNEQRIAEVAQIDDLRLVGTLDQGGLIVGARDTSTSLWRLGCFKDTHFNTLGVEHVVAESRGGGVTAFPNGRAFACVTSDGPRALLTADFSNAHTLVEMLAVQWQQATEVPGRFSADCESFVTGPGPSEATFVTGRQVVSVCSSGGTCTTTTSNALTGSPPPMRLERTGEWTLASFFGPSALGHAGQILRRRDGAGFERVYGPAQYDGIDGKLVRGPDGDPRMLTPTSLIRFKRTSAGVETTTTAISGVGYYPFDAELDESDGSWVVLTSFERDGQPFSLILRLFDDPPRYTTIAEVAASGPPNCFPRVLQQLVQVRPGEILAFNRCGSLARVIGDQVELVALEDLDDPETEFHETAPDNFVISALDVSHGMVWLGGMGGWLARMNGDRIQAFSTARTFERDGYVSEWEGTAVATVRSFCPDRIMFGSGRFMYQTVAAPPEPDRLPLELAPISVLMPNPRTIRGVFGQNPITIAGPAVQYAVIISGAWSLQFEQVPVRSLIEPFDTVEDREGILWLAGPDRRLVLGRPER